MSTSKYKQRSTPGVYVTELDAFPPSIVGVQTAVPGFVGYTEKAEISNKPVLMKPIKINSMVDFQTVFGGGYVKTYKLVEVTEPGEIKAGAYDVSVLSYTIAEGAEPTPGDTKYYTLDSTDSGAGSKNYYLYDSMRLFFNNGGGSCYVVSVGAYGEDIVYKDSSGQPVGLKAGLSAMGDEVGPTMLVVPDGALLPPDSEDAPLVSTQFSDLAKGMLAQSKRLQDRMAILDVYASDLANQGTQTPTLENVIEAFRKSVGEDGLNYGAAYFPFVNATVINVDEIDFRNVPAPETEDEPSLWQLLSWQNISLNYDANQDEGGSRYIQLQADIDKIKPGATAPTGESADKLANDLTAALPLMGDVDRVIIKKQAMLPPSAAMAGIYTANDNNIGVWNAPANVVVNSVASLTFKLKGDEQDDLNRPVDGRAVDAIRDFVGRGPVVWGARTLDGNSPDYRYIQVRRTLIYIEQSVKTALNAFVFAANDGKTWTTVVSMVSGFLNGLWSQGGLMGNSPSEAYTVECGLGSTMTGEDILKGYMIVQITLQMIRPAEFIELTFKQRMEGVA